MDLLGALHSLTGQDVYFHLPKENFNWPDGNSLDFCFNCLKRKVVISLNDDKDASYIASSLPHVLGSGKVLLSWNAKDVFSCLKGMTGINLDLDDSVYDLFVISSYLGIDADKPSTFQKAVSLLKRCLSDSSWKSFQPLYKAVYEPLFSRVLPDIETCCLVDNSRRSCVYPSYVVEGQANGRLRTSKPGPSFYNPHSLGPFERHNLRPGNYDEVFLYFDFKNMEVNVLQWLSGDEQLDSLLKSGKDLYKEIWKLMTKQEPTDAHRKLCKEIFLPVVFGQGKNSLSKKLGVSEKFASKLINNLVDTFPVAFDWVNSQSTECNNTATDVFGRKRSFDSQERYKIKNFCIQSPASMICLRKLVRLHEALTDKASICFHVHDGYCILCNKNEVKSLSELGASVLEEDDPLFQGLKLRVSCESGARLDEMKPLKKGVPL